MFLSFFGRERNAPATIKLLSIAAWIRLCSACAMIDAALFGSFVSDERDSFAGGLHSVFLNKRIEVVYLVEAVVWFIGVPMHFSQSTV